MEELNSGDRKEERVTEVQGDPFNGGKVVVTTKIKDELEEGVSYFNTIVNTSTVKAFETFYILETEKSPEEIKKIMIKNLFGNYTIEDEYVNKRNLVGFYLTPKYQDRICIMYTMLQKNQTEYEYAMKFAPMLCKQLKTGMIMMARELYTKYVKAVFFDDKGNLTKETHFKDSHDSSRVMLEEHKISINDLYMNLMARVNAEQWRLKCINGMSPAIAKMVPTGKLKGITYDQFKHYFPNQEPQDGKVIEQFWFNPFELSEGRSMTWSDGSAIGGRNESTWIPNKIRKIIDKIKGARQIGRRR